MSNRFKLINLLIHRKTISSLNLYTIYSINPIWGYFMEQTEEMQVGKITHYFPKISVAVVEVTDGSIKAGDEIHIKGHTTDFRQKVASMQVEHDKVEAAEPGMSVGMKVNEPVRDHDVVYKSM